MYKIQIFSILLFSVVGPSYAQERCRTPSGDNGICLILDQCEPLNQLNQIEKKTPEDILYLRQSNCGLFMNIRPKVCCPPESQWSSFTTTKPFVHPALTTKPPKPVTTTSPKPTTSSKPDIDNSIPYGTPSFDEFECKPSIKPPMPDSLCCGIEASSDERILGGKQAKPDQYPWLALLEYNNTARRTVCGGALISARYVLTAAHCLGNTIWGTPIKVRLAEYNTTSYPTDEIFSDGGGVEYLTVVEIDIERQIPHPGYKRYENFVDDIGLIKLAKNAPYTDFIRPICLPIRDITISPYKDMSFFAAGWGSDGANFNEIKTSIELPYVPLQKCQIPFQKKRNPVTLIDTHLCAGGEKNRDTCGGDSGGPLMYENGDTFIVVGIVSFGDKFCGTEGTPGVYTHVYKYIDWILKHMV